MSLKLKEEELKKVAGGNDAPGTRVDVKCIVRYTYLGEELSDPVVLKVEVVDNAVEMNKVEEAANEWCVQHLYTFVSVSIAADNDYFVVY